MPVRESNCADAAYASGDVSMKNQKLFSLLAALAVLVAGMPAGSVFAGDIDPTLSPPPSGKTLDTSLPPQTSTYDAAKRVEDLEASRAEVDGKSKSPISLSVTGWVGYQVMVGK
ncbi:hypothetical protein DLM45_04740 [Hyphomicrobium methylovorum]|nr:hypothetical protein [Hyphomicrobium methylovorum]